MVETGSLQPSGRVIAGGRLLLASLFLLAVWSDRSQPARLPAETYSILVAYVVWALVLALATWRNWWLDARLAIFAHVVDIAVFLAMLYSTEGYTSPYYTFFVFLLLSAAIRWGWRETAATAAIVIVAYLSAGLAFAPTVAFDTERFIVRTGHLLILSAILVWFGSSQRTALTLRRTPGDGSSSGDEDPLAGALRVAMAHVGARQGGLLWRSAGSDDVSLTWLDGREPERSLPTECGLNRSPEVPLLYDVERRRALVWGPSGRWKFRTSQAEIDCRLERLSEGLAVPIHSAIGSGIAFFQNVPNLSTDHLELGFRLAEDMAGRLQAAAALSAAEERSMARARGAVARDLHDSIVQFLAGIGFRIEALVKQSRGGADLTPELAELKQLVLGEQAELRDFIGALHTGGSVTVSEMKRELTALCARLASQWDIDCRCDFDVSGTFVAVRLHLDLAHLVREAVANAVRHGNAKAVEITIRSDGDRLSLSIANDGVGIASGTMPASLMARVHEAGGEIDVHGKPGETLLLIRLPAAIR